MGKTLIHASLPDHADLAMAAFNRGFDHGRRGMKPLTCEQVSRIIGLPQWEIQPYHARKFRQIYGAAYDMARANETAMFELEARDLTSQAASEPSANR